MPPAEDRSATGEGDVVRNSARNGDKAALRTVARAARRSIPRPEREAAAKAVADAIGVLPESVAAAWVLAYCANDEELDPAPAVERLRAAGARIAYPRVTGPGTLELHEVADVCELVPGAFSLREPASNAPAVDASEIDVVLVPGVVFDLRGHRVGYGGGFYDRLLAELPSRCTRIGLAFDAQVVDELPEEAHDVAVDLLVTPGQVRRI